MHECSTPESEYPKFEALEQRNAALEQELLALTGDLQAAREAIEAARVALSEFGGRS